ncbi:MAG: thioredoxin-dependent thiol peroxidase [Persicimonas sp.]
MGTNPKLNVGDAAPDFTLESDDAGEVSLSDLRGEKVVLYFYPKDMTPGCTTQACDFRDNLDAFEEEGWRVLGVSPDPVDSHAEFREEHDLNFTLLADPDHEVAESYGVWREKQNYGRTYEGIVRSTFLIDEEGEIVEIQDNVQAKGHVERLLRDHF